MCELYLHATQTPTSLHPGLGEFLAHGNAEYGNTDGWGLAHFNDADAQIFREPVAATRSDLARFLESHPPQTQTLIGHIREGNAGGVSLENTQPLSRYHQGRRLVFAHNGSVKSFRDTAQGRSLEMRATGSADSEIALLALLDHLDGARLGESVAGFADFSRRMAGFGPFNVVVSDGEHTLAFSDRRHHHADGKDADMRGPGFFMTSFEDGLMLSSEPLFEQSRPVPRGTCLHIRRGRLVTDVATPTAA